MRLTAYQRQAIKDAVHQYLPDARVMLYGSRTDDEKRGGDIDLLIYTDRDVNFDLHTRILTTLWQKIGEQKIDILFEKEYALSNFGKIVASNAQAV